MVSLRVDLRSRHMSPAPASRVVPILLTHEHGARRYAVFVTEPTKAMRQAEPTANPSDANSFGSKVKSEHSRS